MHNPLLTENRDFLILKALYVNFKVSLNLKQKFKKKIQTTENREY